MSSKIEEFRTICRDIANAEEWLLGTRAVEPRTLSAWSCFDLKIAAHESTGGPKWMPAMMVRALEEHLRRNFLTVAESAIALMRAKAMAMLAAARAEAEDILNYKEGDL